jgi:hypothetical protein
MTNTIAPGAVLTWNGTTEINRSTYNIGWNSDNSILMRFANNPAIAIFSLGGSYVLGWSTGPTTAGNYVGFSPCVTGTTVLRHWKWSGCRLFRRAQCWYVLWITVLRQLRYSAYLRGVRRKRIARKRITLSRQYERLRFGSIQNGASPAASAILATITFATPLAQQSSVCIPAAQNEATAAARHSLLISPPTTTGFVLSTGSIPLIAAKEFRVGYACF